MGLVTTILLGIGSILIGIGVGYFIAAKTNLLEKFSKEKRGITAIITNPKLLKEKLEANGTIIDLGEEIKFKIIKKDNKEELTIERSPYKPSN